MPLLEKEILSEAGLGRAQIEQFDQRTLQAMVEKLEPAIQRAHSAGKAVTAPHKPLIALAFRAVTNPDLVLDHTKFVKTIARSVVFGHISAAQHEGDERQRYLDFHTAETEKDFLHFSLPA